MRADGRAAEDGRAASDRWREVARVNAAALAEIEKSAQRVAVRANVLNELAEAAARVRRDTVSAALGVDVVGAQLCHSPPRPRKRRVLSWLERRRFERHMRFDEQWYLQQNPDVALSGMDPLEHYLSHGLYEDRDPNALFSAVWYRLCAPTPIGDTPAYAHFLADSARRAWPSFPLFDPEYYIASHRDLGLKAVDALDHFLSKGAQEGRDPHPLVDIWWLAAQPGLEDSRNPLLDYITRPDLHDASPHPLFDGSYYLSENSDVAAAQANPLLHYVVVGWRQGRDPHALFAGDWYLSVHPDVRAAGVNPLAHYVLTGAEEGRKPHPLFDPDYYLEHNPDAAGGGRRGSLVHYIRFGSRQECETTRTVSVADMRAVTPPWAIRNFDPITAFIRHGQSSIDIPQHFVVDEDDPNETPRIAWPPKPAFWLPQRLRDYIIERHGENVVDLYVYLMSLVDRFGERPGEFARARELSILIERMTKLAGEKDFDRADVDVSIIIPVYDNLVFSLTAVVSILEHGARRSYEIIIGDDQSKDATPDVFGHIDGVVRLVRHEKNLGFLGNCNACAAQARGRYVVMLNNDTLVLPGWLDELIDPFESDSSIGYVGSKLLNADGTLQEAGGIFWSDGSAWNFGRNSDPRRPEFNYLKDVDYISGASIALPRDLWNELGGFDPIFSPAYCEDADLAFRVREFGKRCVYAPHSELIHHEGKSHGVDTTSGVKAYQVANMKKLLARWRERLEREHFPNGSNVFLARDRSRNKPHVLIADHYVPQWDRDAGSRSMFHIIRMFVNRGYHVIFWPDNLNEDREYAKKLQNMGVEVIYSGHFANKFEQFIADIGMNLDCAVLHRPHIAIHYYDALRAHSNAPVIYYGADIHHLRMEQEYAVNPSESLAAAIEDMRKLEYDNWRRADAILYPSKDESDFIRKAMPGANVADIPVYAYTRQEQETGRRNLATFDARDTNELVFVGGSHPPNVDALKWFTQDIFPLVLAQRPDVRLNIVGASIPDEIRRMASESIRVRGRLSDEDLDALYATVGAVVVPLRFGGGVKGKVIDALFNAAPLVTTSVGLQGLSPAQPVSFVADSAEEFAKAALQALEDRTQARRRVEAGLDYIADCYSEDALAATLSAYAPALAPSTAAQEGLKEC